MFRIDFWRQNRLRLLVGFIFVSVSVLSLGNLDDRIWYFFHDLTTPKQTKETSIWLPNYQADRVALPIPGIVGNASGITFNRDRQTLWIVVNSPTYLVELDLELNLLRRVELKNFRDTEAIAYVGEDHFLLTDERDQTITLASIDSQTEVLDKETLEQIVLNVHEYGNKGLEGVAVDPESKTVFAVRERDPMELIRVTGFLERKNQIRIDHPDSVEVGNLYVDDLSGLHFDADTGHLLLLSDESKLLAEIDLEGNKISYMDLERGFNRLDQAVPQAEGVTLDDDGRLYVVSEPNLLYRYQKVVSSDSL